MPRYSGKQPGDPARAAEAVIKALQSPTPPRHLVLGRQGLEIAQGQLTAMLQEFEQWRETSLSADYPAAAGAE
jgi:transketolase